MTMSPPWLLLVLVVVLLTSWTGANLLLGGDSPWLSDPLDDIAALEDGGGDSGYRERVQAFANASSEFVQCIVLHAHPFTMCQNCVNRYQRANETFEAISSDESAKSMLSKDRSQVVNSVHQQILDWWADSNCDYCFCISKENGTLNFTTKGEVLEIDTLFNNTYKCIEIHNKTTYYYGDKNLRNVYNETCANCSEAYRMLNDYYDVLAAKHTDHGRTSMCMDVVDMVNSTRRLWSEILHCNSLEMDSTLLIIIMSFFGILPVFLYLGAWIQSEDQQHAIIPQKRLDPCRSATDLAIN